MSNFLTEKQKQDIKTSLNKTRQLLFKVETTMHLDTDDNILYHLKEDIEVRLKIVTDFMKAAKMYKVFEDAKGNAKFKE